MELDIKPRPSHSRTVALTHYVLCVFSDSHVRLFVAPWTAARQTPLSMKFPRQEYWSALPFPPPGDLSHLEIKHLSLVSASGFFTTEPLGKPLSHCTILILWILRSVDAPWELFQRHEKALPLKWFCSMCQGKNLMEKYPYFFMW